MIEPPPRPLGTDRIEAGPGGQVVLVCPLPKSWTPRKAGTHTSPEYPGTAVEWEGRLFEVIRADPTADGGMRYGLAPWEEGHVIRRLERYDEASERAREDERSRRRGSVRNRRLSILLAPFLGLLPGEIQKDMEHDFDAPATGMTIASAAPLFVIGFLGLFRFMVGGIGGTLAFPAWIAPPFPIAAYLFAESWLRLASAIAGAEPMGSLPVVLAFAVWRSARRPGAQGKTAAGSDAGTFREQDARDRFRILEPALALLSANEQDLLAGRFGFDALRWGRITAGVIVAASVLNTIVSMAAFAGGTGGVAEILWFLPVGYLVVEQILRLKSFASGHPAGSVLGRLVRPFARPLLRATDAPGFTGPP